jgi:hypothetical protein
MVPTQASVTHATRASEWRATSPTIQKPLFLEPCGEDVETTPANMRPSLSIWACASVIPTGPSSAKSSGCSTTHATPAWRLSTSNLLACTVTAWMTRHH